MPLQVLLIFIGLVSVYSALFSIGSFVYQDVWLGVCLAAVSLLSTVVLFKVFGKLKF
jgi:solute:Na+ symporter, SSS family